MKQAIARARRARQLATGFLAAAVAFAPGLAGAADAALAAPLCGALKKVLPQVRGFKPEGARAQLVMEVAEVFDYDRDKLRRARLEGDAATAASGPKERESMLGITKAKSLAEALG